MILHTVNKSFLSNRCLQDCLALCTAKASILLIEDGVYAATASASALINPHKHISFYALKADVTARGLMEKLAPQIKLVDDAGFVELCIQHDTVQSWF